MNKQEFRNQLTGPVPSVSTPFHKDGSVDYKSLQNMVDFFINAGAKTVMLTAGDSHYLCLSDQEIAEITKVVVRQTQKRAMVIAADRRHSTNRAIEFAGFCLETGADMLMCMPPQWAKSCTPQTLAQHYAEVAKHIPVMIVTNVFEKYTDNFGLQTIKNAIELSDNIVAIKDDMCGRFLRRLATLAGDRTAVIAGGQKENHMDGYPYGLTGYLSTFMKFKPEIAWKYWHAIENQEIFQASRVITQYDQPFFQHIASYPGGFDAALHGVTELYGLTGRWRREPYYSLNDQEMEELKTFLQSIKVL